MEQIWYIEVEEQREGPFSPEELRFDKRVTLDTLVWREGFPEWVPLRMVVELRKLFTEDHYDDDASSEKEELVDGLNFGGDVLVGEQNEPPYYIIFFLLVITVLLYAAAKLLG